MKRVDADEAAQRRKKRKKLGSALTTALLVLMLLTGLAVLAYPTFSNWWNSLHMTRVITDYIEAVNDVSDEQSEALMEEARAYNEMIAQKENPYLVTREEMQRYLKLLDVTGSGVIGYIQIDGISVYLPIYHTTDDAVMQIAIGHLPWSSLPIGGESTHALLTGHRGLPSAKLFTDLDKLREGNTFTITVLRQTLTYQIDQIRIIEPQEVNELVVIPGEDYCTLITCTPYGVNTHRLLVRGVRIENAKTAATVVADALRIPTTVSALAVGVPMVFLFLFGMLILSPRHKDALSEEELLKKL